MTDLRPKPSTRTVESLGKTTYETKPNLSNVIAGYIIGTGMVIGGLLCAGNMIRQLVLPGGNPPAGVDGWVGAIFAILLGLALAVGGGFVIQFARSLVGFRLRVCQDGIWITRRNQQFVFAWDEIQRVKETIIEERLPLVKGPAKLAMPIKKTRTYTVVRCDGEEFYFDENVVSRTSIIAGPLSTAARTHNIEWETKEQKL